MTDTMIDGVDYGPLAQLAGTWKGDKGLDVAPLPDGDTAIPFHETILFEAIGDVTNAQRQTLSVLRYHQIVVRKEDEQVFHNETGYYSWDPASNTVCQSLTIPRGLALLAGGECSKDTTQIEVRAKLGDPDWGITQSPFMRDNAKTVGFHHLLEVSGDELRYEETTFLEIYGRSFDHTDANTLQRA